MGVQLNIPQGFVLVGQSDTMATIENPEPEGYTIGVARHSLAGLSLEDWITTIHHNQPGRTLQDYSTDERSGIIAVDTVPVAGGQGFKILLEAQGGQALVFFIPDNIKQDVYILRFYTTAPAQVGHFENNVSEILRIVERFAPLD
jgi:hypothetical protein